MSEAQRAAVAARLATLGVGRPAKAAGGVENNPANLPDIENAYDDGFGPLGDGGSASEAEDDGWGDWKPGDAPESLPPRNDAPPRQTQPLAIPAARVNSRALIGEVTYLNESGKIGRNFSTVRAT